MSLRKFMVKNIPSISRDESDSPDIGDVHSRTKHAYTVWDETQGNHWFLVDVGPPTGQHAFYVRSDAQDVRDPRTFWSAVGDALRQGYFSIHISKGSWAPCEFVNRFEGPNLVMSEPVIDECSLRFVRHVLDNRGLELVEREGEFYVYKYAVKPDLLMVLQCEVENYKRTSPEFGRDCVRGFLLPFTGKALASDDWKWTLEDKESLMLDILDAVHDFEVRGVVHTDLKCANILLTLEGIKLIDLDFLGSTSPWSSPFEADSRQAAVHTFGKTIWELFTEQVPHGTTIYEVEVEGSLPPYVMGLVRDCCVEHKYTCVKQLYDATEQILGPVRARRIPNAKLIASQETGKKDIAYGGTHG